MEINLTGQDLDLIARVVETEIPRSIGRSNPAVYQEMVKAVVDTVTNRVASPQFPDTVEGVLNQRRAFSKITGPKRLSPYGSAGKAPQASAQVQQIVNSHAQARAQGVPSVVGDSLHYANPNYSDASNLVGWIRPMIQSGARRLGIGRAVHYHGNAPGFSGAPAYTVAVQGQPAKTGRIGQVASADLPVPSPRPNALAALFGVTPAAAEPMPFQEPSGIAALPDTRLPTPTPRPLSRSSFDERSGPLPTPAPRAFPIPQQRPFRAAPDIPTPQSRPYPIPTAAPRSYPVPQPAPRDYPVPTPRPDSGSSSTYVRNPPIPPSRPPNPNAGGVPVLAPPAVPVTASTSVNGPAMQFAPTVDQVMGSLMAPPADTVAVSDALSAIPTVENYVPTVDGVPLSQLPLADQQNIILDAVPPAKAVSPMVAPPPVRPKPKPVPRPAPQPAPAPPPPEPVVWKVPTGTDFWQGKSNFGMATNNDTLWRADDGTVYRYSDEFDRVNRLTDDGRWVTDRGSNPLSDLLGGGITGKGGASKIAKLAGVAGMGALGAAIGGKPGAAIGVHLGKRITGFNPQSPLNRLLGMSETQMESEARIGATKPFVSQSYSGGVYPAAPATPPGGTSDSTSFDYGHASSISPAAASAARSGTAGLF